ncbi:MAG: hypothetical protein C5B51_06270 [Terriglobia bacterium]|nr:MAG: hypothetical protein C5B51_06270 [Terriglobia bacterium]
MNDDFRDPSATFPDELYGAFFPGLVECPVCFGPHDEETHTATLNVRRWFRDEVTKSFRIQPVV